MKTGGNDTDISCAPETQGGEAASAQTERVAPTATRDPATGEAPAEDHVPRVSRSLRDGHPILRSTLHARDAELTFVASPTREPDRLYLTLVLSARPSHAECPVGILVDGSAHSLSLHRHEPLGTREKPSFIVPIALLRDWAQASRAVGRICQEALELTTEDSAVLAELLARFDEEIAWQVAQSAPTGQAAPPASPPPAGSDIPAP